MLLFLNSLNNLDCIPQQESPNNPFLSQVNQALRPYCYYRILCDNKGMLSTLLYSLLVTNTLTISPIAFSIHGTSIGNPAPLKNKIDKKGVVAYNPMLSLLYRTDHWQWNVAYLKDCSNNDAGYATFGPYLSFARYFTAGAMIGPYIRKHRSDYVQTITTPTGAKGTQVIPQNKLPLSVRNHAIEVALMTMVTVSARVPLTQKISAEMNVGSNGMLTNIQLGLQWNFD